MPPLFSATDYSVAPAADEIEVSLIGPGYGEAVLVHVGDGQWSLIDSCIAKGESAPAPLRYLNDIGADTAKVVSITASHWDDDHIKGLADLVTACPNAKFVLASALMKDEFQVYAAAYDTPLTAQARSGVRELRKTLQALEAQKRTTLTYAHADRCIFSPGVLTASHGEPIQVWTFSPCDREFENFLAWIAQQMPSIGETRRVAISRHRNDLSVVVYISIGDEAVLLGGDLEEEGKADTGWSAIISSTGRPTGRASLHKIAHHGSANGDHVNIWTDLLTQEPTAVLAPFRSGSVNLPTTQDVARILGNAPNAFATARSGSRRPRRRDPRVEKTIREATKTFGVIPRELGMVRLRKKIGTGNSWQAELFGDARHLADVHK